MTKQVISCNSHKFVQITFYNRLMIINILKVRRSYIKNIDKRINNMAQSLKIAICL